MTAEKTILNWGILGAARVTEKLIPAIIEANNAKLVAVASRRKGAAAEALAKLAPENNDILALDDPEALLSHPDIDVIHLPMANEEHAEWALKAIAHGKHLLIEKPMALTVKDIDAITQAAKEKGVKVMEGFMYRFHPQHDAVREIIESGVIGDVRTVSTRFAFPMKPARLYRVNRPIENGGGAMWDIGPYAIHTARLWFDEEPKAVTAVANINEHGADLSLTGVFDYGNGRFAQFEISFEHARRSVYEIIGTLGGITCHTTWQPADETAKISWWTEAGQQETVEVPAADQFVNEIEHFSDCVMKNTDPLLSLEDARANCQAIVAALQSVKEGKTVQF
ncbi:MAG: Gfo/Idh/MocA family oxidoreductase [Methylophaga nitratireducenticrescens]|uniref:Gfo/Idh/MocA family protein n=1 Tax=Methylophaga sp. SB9B TaxID=2570356 RepID=UPI0010A86521|nr:Gfo/Idh/MocA family oxidoreductase [Methylophaga sp. SB9B]THF58693.1 MAG: Gfo/Idh/MocA family oxidoreductase [Methylophaga nitratireducenticrescens]THK41113.1 Gfo/Idh/MocA family oxidoreductase [Methylophaga sp. SB9B]